LHFTDVLNIDEPVLFSINREDRYFMCTSSAESAYIERCLKGHRPKKHICYNTRHVHSGKHKHVYIKMHTYVCTMLKKYQ